MSNPVLNVNMAFKEQVETNLTITFDIKMVPMKKMLSKENTHVLSLMMFNANIKSMILNLLVSFLYWTIEKYLYAYYLCLQQVKPSLK